VRQWNGLDSLQSWSFTRVPLIGRHDTSIFEWLPDLGPSIWSWLTVESMISTVPLASSGVKRWSEPAMVRRWVGTGMIEAHPEGAAGACPMMSSEN